MWIYITCEISAQITVDLYTPEVFFPKPQCKWLLQLFSIKPTYIGWTLGIAFFLTLHVTKHWARAVAFISLAKAARYPPIKCSHEIVQLGMNSVFFFHFYTFMLLFTMQVGLHCCPGNIFCIVFFSALASLTYIVPKIRLSWTKFYLPLN